MEPYIGKRLLRRPLLSALSLVLSGVLAFLLCFLSGYRQEQELRLAEARSSFNINCVVTDLRGTKSTGLQMEGEVADFVLSPDGLGPYVRDVRLVKEFQYSEYPPGEYGGFDLLGLNTPAAAPALDETAGGGYTLLREDFFDSGEYLVLVSEGVYRGLEGETTYTVYVTDPITYRPQYYGRKGVGQIEFTVAGWYPGAGTTLYIPYPAAQRLMDELSEVRTVDSISFYAAHNDELDALSKAAGKKFSMVLPNASTRNPLTKPALTIHDEQYRATLAALNQNITRTGYLLPVIAVLSLAAGFLVCFLATRGEARTYALMRTLGMTRWRLLGSVLVEQLVIPLVTSAVVGAAVGRPGPAAVSFAFHTLGSAVAAVRSVRVPPNAILRNQE